jgi:transcriptional regulator with XRE-family HTH domain
MDVGRALLEARTAAGLSQRQLAMRAGVPQSTVARIERRQLMPRVDTFDRLLRASGKQFATEPLFESGVDRSQIRAILALSPRNRLRQAVSDSDGLERFLNAARPGSSR